jgi:hypothetical protein
MKKANSYGYNWTDGEIKILNPANNIIVSSNRDKNSKKGTTNMEELKNQFHDDMIKYHHSRVKGGYPATIIWNSIQENGGYETAKKFSGAARKGFLELVERNLLPFSIEALILQPKYAPLFPKSYREVCQNLLAKYGYKV